MEKFCSPEKKVKVHPRSPDVSPIDRPYTSFYRHSYSKFGSRLFRFRDVVGFVSQMPLLRMPPRLSPKIWRYFPRVRSMWSVVQ